MIRKDYIMRMIAEFVKVILKILRLKENKEYQTILQTTDQTFKQFFGLTSKLIISISDEDLISMMKSGEVLDPDKCIIIAELLKEEADIYESQNKLDETNVRYLKSLNLLLEAFLSNSDANLSDHFSEIESIINKLEKYELPVRTKNKLLQYYEKVGKYAKVEDLLFELIETNRSDRDTLEKGIHFYERLLSKSDGELVTGNLPREEVEESLATLKDLKRQN